MNIIQRCVCIFIFCPNWLSLEWVQSVIRIELISCYSVHWHCIRNLLVYQPMINNWIMHFCSSSYSEHSHHQQINNFHINKTCIHFISINHKNIIIILISLCSHLLFISGLGSDHKSIDSAECVCLVSESLSHTVWSQEIRADCSEAWLSDQ